MCSGILFRLTYNPTTYDAEICKNVKYISKYKYISYISSNFAIIVSDVSSRHNEAQVKEERAKSSDERNHTNEPVTHVMTPLQSSNGAAQV